MSDAPRPQRSPTESPREQSYERLLALLEGAEYGSYSLDCEIWRVVAGEHADKIRPPAYSVSLDAALTLVPEGYLWGVGNERDDDEIYQRAVVTNWDENIHVHSEGATAAIALCRAALKARSAR